MIAAFLTASGAAAAEYVCRVPRALLCQGCASQIVVTLQPGNRCRISFTPDGTNATNLSAEQLELQIEAPAFVVTRAPPTRLLTWRARRFAVAKPAPALRCFVFNGQSYCE